MSITQEFKKDLKWFNTFLSVYNGVCFFQHIPSKVIHIDECFYGLGAISDSEVYAWPLPVIYQHLYIAYLQVTVLNRLCFLECLNYNGVKQPQVANYLSAIKTQFILCGLDVACFTDASIKYYQKAVPRQAPLEIKLSKSIDISIQFYNKFLII